MSSIKYNDDLNDIKSKERVDSFCSQNTDINSSSDTILSTFNTRDNSIFSSKTSKKKARSIIKHIINDVDKDENKIEKEYDKYIDEDDDEKYLFDLKNEEHCK